MAIDVDQPLSPGWWMLRLARQLEAKQKRLKELNDRFEGNAPLPRGAESLKAAVKEFQCKSRTNFAELVVTSARRRMQIVGIGTAAVADDRGDELAWRWWSSNDMAAGSADVHESMGTVGEGYVMVSPVDPEIGVPVVSQEDPRLIITEHDPLVPRRVRAGFKTFHDDASKVDYAYLYLPAERPGAGARVFKAQRPAKRAAARFNPSAWEWSPDGGGADGLLITRGVDRVPVVRFLNNRRALGDFEPHIDLLDRISHQILQRMVIATFQAFRQRAVKGDLPDKDPDTGEVINYDDVLAADPGALWRLPAGIDMWESGQVDLTPILKAVKDDLQELSAVTSVPLHVFSPDAATQSAEGASLLKEQETFKVDDKIARVSGRWCDVAALAFEYLGDQQRSDRSKLRIQWAPVDRPSLTEKANAAAQAQNDLPLRHRLTDIWGYPLDVVDEMMAEKSTEALLAEPIPAVAPDAAA